MPTLLLQLGSTLALSLALALYLTPIVRRGALEFGVVDRPDGRLKRQRAPVAYLGGIAVYLAFLLTLALVFEFEADLLGLLLGGTLVLMLGLFDDMKVLPPALKLGGQALAVLVLLKSGVSIQLELLPHWAALALSIVWLLGVTNAFNILDVSDGLAAGVGAVCAAALGGVALLHGDRLIATTALALAGALAGFLRYNRSPASIYLGDAGSLFIGFMLAALAMIGNYTRTSAMGALAPLGILFVPLLETTLVSLARLSRGASPLTGSTDHLALRLQKRGWTPRAVAGAAYATSAVTAALGVGLIFVTAQVAFVIVGGLAALALGLIVWLWRWCPRPGDQAAAPVGDASPATSA